MKSIQKKKLVWVTADYFVDCDFNIDILTLILRQYDIYWIILLPSHNARYAEADFDTLQTLEGLTIEFLYSGFRQRNPRRIAYYYGVYKRINRLKPDVTYLNFVPDPYFLPVFLLLDKKRTIFCAHDGGVHKGFELQKLYSAVFKLTYSNVKYVCMFSPSQAKLFHTNFPQATIYTILLALKSFGNGASSKADDKVVFLSFGVINYSKNIDLLIDAACNIYEQGYKNFKVSINGQCSNWEFYQSRIRYPEIFDCNIRMIENREIADLFSRSHYFVQPYRHVSQSGAMKVSFHYNVPVLASDFSGFSDEVKDDVNGYLFKPGDVEELEKLMIHAIRRKENEYGSLLNRMLKHTRDNYSSSVLAGKYLNMFNEVISKSK